MAGESLGVYVMVGGVLTPAATVPGPKGSKGDKGDPGDPGPQGQAAEGVTVDFEPPLNPTLDTVWIDKGGV